MKIKAIAPWFGGKRRLAERIVQALGPHRAYWDPFCGSLAVPFAKPAATMEVVNDLHEDLVNLARVVKSNTLAPALFDRILRTAMHEDLFMEAAARVRSRGPLPGSRPCVDAAYDYIVMSWMGMNGVSGTANTNSNFCARYTANGGHAAKRFMSVGESIPEWWRRLRNVTILRRDAFELIPRIGDAKGTVMYVDPPYLVKGAKYMHDFKASDHARLADALHRFKKLRVVVSYYDHPDVRRLYRGWTFVPVHVNKALVASGRRDRDNPVTAPEVLVINGPEAV